MYIYQLLGKVMQQRRQAAGILYFGVGIDDIFIGSTEFQIQNERVSSPKIEIEVGYFYDSGYTGSAPPFPGSMKKVITLTPFCKVLTC
ncbi:hypothetical protein DF211_11120 [Pectobacterium parmentieri]|nr:hypothetical protein DF211_11120 [Pectobacterium parmentieri]